MRTGKRYKLSGVVRSENQKAPPPLRDGTFSTMLEIYTQKEKKNQKKSSLNKENYPTSFSQMRIVIKNKGADHVEDDKIWHAGDVTKSDGLTAK